LKFHQFFTGKLIYFVPFAVIFVANLLITQIKGFEYAGQLAVFIASSSFLAIILGLRWDISLLASPSNKVEENLIYGTISIFFISAVLISLFLLAYSVFRVFYPFLLLVLFASMSISLSELLVNTLLKLNQPCLYILFRSLPYVFLVCFSAFGASIEMTWMLSSFLSLFFLIFISKRAFKVFKIKIIKLGNNLIYQMLLKIVPTFSAVITNSIMLVWLIYIQQNFGDEASGVWINAYRIFSLPVALIGAAFLPVLISKLSAQKSFKNQIKKMMHFNISLLPLILIVTFIIFISGRELFQLLTNTTQFIDHRIMYGALFIGSLQYSLQYWKELFQSINRDALFLFIIIIQPLIVASIYLFYFPVSLVLLLNIVLATSLISYIVLLVVLAYLYFFTTE
jgi:hypothetical protein